MSALTAAIIFLLVFLLVIFFFVVYTSCKDKGDAGNQTELTLEVPKLFKVHFKRENNKK